MTRPRAHARRGIPAIGGGVTYVQPTARPRYTFTGLTPDRQYGIIALAVDGAGNYSQYSASYPARTRPDTAAASVPAGVRDTPTRRATSRPRATARPHALAATGAGRCGPLRKFATRR